MINGTRSSCIQRPQFNNFTPWCYGGNLWDFFGLVADVDRADFLRVHHPGLAPYYWEALPTVYVPGFTSLEEGYYQYLPVNQTKALQTLR